MKPITTKAALACAVALLPLSAFAQTFDEGETPPWMVDGAPSEEEFYDEPGSYEEGGDDLPPWMRAEGGESRSGTARSTNSSVALPPPGAEVSLDGYDKMMEGLTEDIDARLNQLSLNGAKTDLPDPSSAEQASIMEQLAADQREIKLLESKIAKAKLAKELWGELNTDDRDDLLAQIEELREANATLQEEAQARQEALESEAAAAAARVAELEFELEMAETATPAPQTVVQQAAAAEAAPSTPPNVLVEAITITAGRRAARISFPGGGIRTFGIGDSLGADMGRVESIDPAGVRVKMPKGDVVSLERGSFRADPDEPANIGTSVDGGFEEFGTGLDYLDEVSDFANPDESFNEGFDEGFSEFME